MHVLMISGINMPGETTWEPFKKHFKKYLPHATFSAATEPNCYFFETSRFRAFVRKTAAEYDNGEDLILVGHSLGGVLACAVQTLLRNTRVLGIATIHSPNTYLGGIWPYVLNGENITAPIITFQALRDEILWTGSRHPKSLAHVMNQSDHLFDLLKDNDLAERITEATVRAFVPDKAAAA